jgi:hypothetical protein
VIIRVLKKATGLDQLRRNERRRRSLSAAALDQSAHHQKPSRVPNGQSGNVCGWSLLRQMAASPAMQRNPGHLVINGGGPDSEVFVGDAGTQTPVIRTTDDRE